MNRTIKDATVKRYFYETHDQLRTNFARRLENSQRPHPIRIHLQCLDFAAAAIQNQSDRANAGTTSEDEREADPFHDQLLYHVRFWGQSDAGDETVRRNQYSSRAYQERLTELRVEYSNSWWTK